MMKSLFFIVIMGTSLFGGFFTNEDNGTQKENSENERLCKLFTLKAEKYQKSMRDDELAKKTLLSYKKRAKTFCDKAKALH